MAKVETGLEGEGEGRAEGGEGRGERRGEGGEDWKGRQRQGLIGAEAKSESCEYKKRKKEKVK